jgi:hypothetical protein
MRIVEKVKHNIVRVDLTMGELALLEGMARDSEGYPEGLSDRVADEFAEAFLLLDTRGSDG